MRSMMGATAPSESLSEATALSEVTGLQVNAFHVTVTRWKRWCSPSQEPESPRRDVNHEIPNDAGDVR